MLISKSTALPLLFLRSVATRKRLTGATVTSARLLKGLKTRSNSDSCGRVGVFLSEAAQDISQESMNGRGAP